MLKKLGGDIRYCYERALELALRASETADPDLKAELEAMQDGWCRLAESYELSDRLQRFLWEQDTRITKRLEWQPIATAPFDRNIELSVINGPAPHGLAFPCRRILHGWLNAETGERIDVRPTHWRDWISSSP